MPGILRKREVFELVTPIPGFIPRQLAVDILHSHTEVITLNPLVTDHKPVAAPRNAQTDEYYATWYEITQRIQFIPGLGRLGQGEVKFNGCFHNMPWGLQTHVYVHLGIELRNTYRICGNQPGVEPPEQLEMGLTALGAPSEGLFLRESIEIKANITLIRYVKEELKKAGGEMVRRIIKKAELLDAGELEGMVENGKLRTINPHDRRCIKIKSPLESPSQLHGKSEKGIPGSPSFPSTPYQIPRLLSDQHVSGQSGRNYRHGQAGAMESLALRPSQTLFSPVELPGDFQYSSPSLQPPQHSPGFSLQFSRRDSSASTGSRASSNPSQSEPWSPSDSRPISIASNITGGSGGVHSPCSASDHKGFAAELPTHKETNEEHRYEGGEKPAKPSRYPPFDAARSPPVKPLPELPPPKAGPIRPLQPTQYERPEDVTFMADVGTDVGKETPSDSIKQFSTAGDSPVPSVSRLLERIEAFDDGPFGLPLQRP